MDIILSRFITLEESTKQWRTVTKTFNSAIAPRVGDIVESSAFERDEEVKVVEVAFNYEENYCYVYLEKLSLPSKDISILKQTVDMYISHEWECGYYGFDD